MISGDRLPARREGPQPRRDAGGAAGDGPTRPEAQPHPAAAAHARRSGPRRQDQHRASWRSPRKRPPAPRRGVSLATRRPEAKEPLSPTTRQIALLRRDAPRWSRQVSWFNHLVSFGEDAASATACRTLLRKGQTSDGRPLGDVCELPSWDVLEMAFPQVTALRTPPGKRDQPGIGTRLTAARNAIASCSERVSGQIDVCVSCTARRVCAGQSVVAASAIRCFRRSQRCGFAELGASGPAFSLVRALGLNGRVRVCAGQSVAGCAAVNHANQRDLPIAPGWLVLAVGGTGVSRGLL